MSPSRHKKQSFDESLLTALLLLMLIGLIMIYSISSIYAENRFGSHFFFLKNQIIWTGLSLVVLYLIMKLDLKRLAVYSAPVLLMVILMLTLVFLMPARNGSHRWLMLGFASIQPSELFKFVMIVYLSFSLANPKRDVTDLKQVLFPYLPILGLGVGLILIEPDLGTAMVICMTAVGIFFMAGIRIKHLAIAIVPVISVAALIVFGIGYKSDRINAYTAAFSDPGTCNLDKAYQIKQAALAIGSGGIFGQGLGDGHQKLFFLPYPHTDFIFASIGEEMGLIGLLIILILFFFILVRGMKIAARQPDRFGYLLASGMTLSLFINIAINLGVVTAILPVTGLPLPFLSYGGSSLLVSTASVGILLNLSRRVTR